MNWAIFLQQRNAWKNRIQCNNVQITLEIVNCICWNIFFIQDYIKIKWVLVKALILLLHKRLSTSNNISRLPTQKVLEKLTEVEFKFYPKDRYLEKESFVFNYPIQTAL